MNFSLRLRRLRAGMKAAGFDCLLLSSANDIFYYTGFRIDDNDVAYLKIDRGSKPLLFVSPLDNFATEIKSVEVRFIKRLTDLELPKTVGFDEYSMSAATFKALSKRINLKQAAKTIKKPRMIKDSHELEQIKKALGITARALGSVELFKRREDEVARDIDIAFRKASANNAFDTIVASGKNSAFIHCLPSNKEIGNKDLIIIDLGARFNGYCSDISRTFCKNPGSRERELFENIKAIQAEVIDNIEPGMEFKVLNKLYEGLMKKEGYTPLHGVGHGVGLNVHEVISGRLEKNMVITVEPGAYIKGFGGCRIEDMVLVGKKTRVLSNKIKQVLQ